MPHSQRPVRLPGEPVAGPALGEEQERSDPRDDEQRHTGQPDPDPERGGRDPPGRVVDDADVARIHTRLDRAD